MFVGLLVLLEGRVYSLYTKLVLIILYIDDYLMIGGILKPRRQAELLDI